MLSERKKKILLIGLFVISVLVIGGLLYYLFFAPSGPGGGLIGQPTNISVVGNNVLPSANTGAAGVVVSGEEGGVALPAAEVAAGGITKTNLLTTAAVASVTLSSDGQGVNYYDAKDGRFYTINADGTVTRLSNKQFPDAETVDWNKVGDTAVIEFPDGSNVVYNFTTEIQTTLPKHWEDFRFSPANDNIIAKSIGLDPSNRVLVVSNEDGSQVKAVQALGENADKVQINPSPNDDVIAFSDTGDAQSDFTRKVIIPIGQNQENFKSFVVEGLGFEGRWSPRGDTLIYSAYGSNSNYKPLLWLISGSANSIGDSRRSVGLYTWADKCVFADNNTVYCAVPQKLDDNAGYQPSLSRSEPDDLYKLDIRAGRATLTARPEENTSMENLQVSSDGSVIYYTNALNDRLEYIKLK
jgi:hypothetical protein